jgi:hypothetical protein
MNEAEKRVHTTLTELQESADRLKEIRTTFREALIQALSESLSEEEIQGLIEEEKALASRVNSLGERAKAEIKELGVSSFKYGDDAIKVSQTKKPFIAPEILVRRAEKIGDIPVLLNAGVLFYQTDASKLDLLPPEIRTRYEELRTSVVTRTAITLPSSLKE